MPDGKEKEIKIKLLRELQRQRIEESMQLNGGVQRRSNRVSVMPMSRQSNMDQSLLSFFNKRAGEKR